MQCVSTIKYKVAHNGEEIDPIYPKRGLKHEDPLSPYMFILCVKGLLSFLKHLECQNLINGCKFAKTAPVITHLLFANNSYRFFRANL